MPRPTVPTSPDPSTITRPTVRQSHLTVLPKDILLEDVLQQGRSPDFRCVAARSAATIRVARVRCAPARRSSYGRGSGAQPPENFWEILLPRVHFYNRVHFFTAVFNMLKMIYFIRIICYQIPIFLFWDWTWWGASGAEPPENFWKIRAARTHLRASES